MKARSEEGSGQGWIGRSVRRKEDERFLTGREKFIEDINLPDQVYAVLVRSPYAHARILRIDCSKALQYPGVAGVYTGDDVKEISTPLYPDGEFEGFTNHCLSVGKVRYAGEPVAAVVARTRAEAVDALEGVEVSYEPLKAVHDAEEALESQFESLLFEEHGSNILYERKYSYGDPEKALKKAPVVIKERFYWGRTSGSPIECFGCIASYNPRLKNYTVYSNLQGQRFQASMIAETLKAKREDLQFIAASQGGSFGSKFSLSKYVVLICLLSKLQGLPVKWIETRMEHLQASSSSGPERTYNAEIALSRDGLIRALRIDCLDDLGAYFESTVQPKKPLTILTGPYDIRDVEFNLKVVFTNKNPQGAYRGAGPPPHTFVIERLVDRAARRLGIDAAELRRRNLIPSSRFPYVLASGYFYDSGDYHTVLEKLLRTANYRELRERQKVPTGTNSRIGIGLSTVVDPSVPASIAEGVRLTVDESGELVVGIGFGLEGQGHETTLSQILAEEFHTSPGKVRIEYLDSRSSPPSLGPGGSRMAAVLTGAVQGASTLLKQEILKAASTALRINRSRLSFRNGRIIADGTEMSLQELLARAKKKRISVRYVFMPEKIEGLEVKGGPSFDEMSLATPFAAHLAVVEVDTETGLVKVRNYWAVHDSGKVINPIIVEGQVQGGIAQGLGQALLESAAYDKEGQLVSSTFGDYLLPSSMEVPNVHKVLHETLSPYTPLGVKGIGEIPISAATAAIANAIEDAIHDLGGRIREAPATPEKIWSALRES